MRRWSAAALTVAAIAPAGCGDESPSTAGGGGEPSRASAYVDPSVEPFVNTLAMAADGRTLLLTTNRGFFGIRDGTATRIASQVRSTSGSSPVGNQLVVEPVGAREMLGSGHPDLAGGLPQFLGLLRSTDEGRTWDIVSGLGTADYHTIHLAGDRIFAADGAVGTLAISDDDGRTFEQRPIPEGISFDMAVDPSEPQRVVVTNERSVLRSEDEGRTWRPVADAATARVEWPASGTLVRAAADGTIAVSDDAGDSFEEVGEVDGVPQQLLATDARTLHVALEDATILRSRDGGRSWRPVFEPPPDG